MTFKLSFASDGWRATPRQIELNTLDELLALSKLYNKQLIIDQDMTIVVYDDYIE